MSETVGPYKLLQELGEGGFGVVYQAEQTAPVRRTVALKIIKQGMDTRQVVARFEAERQALALMDHPNIAKVLDAGATEKGRPYFVMELVKGIPITEYCDQAKLDTAERLDLFTQVCHAVQHAHQKGIIHRDIKPSNILVALHDGRPVPKVIDFGIAKATDHRLTEKTLFTEFRQMIGTPEYMAPEQAEMSGLDIDARADIYSLGVLLYELLTGTKPFDLSSLLQEGYDVMLKTIREVDPPNPSLRVSTMGERLVTVADQRHTPPRHLGKVLRGELDWIIMKALEKDRSRRYDTANDLAQDIQRYLEHRPVEAGRPGLVYRMRKYARRHRLGVVAGSLVSMALVFGVVSAVTGYVEAAEKRDVAGSASRAAVRDAEAAGKSRERAAKQRALAQGREQDAKTQAAKTGTVLDLVQKMLGSANPEEVKGRDYTVRQLLDDFDRDLGDTLEDQPDVEAQIRTTMGNAYRGLGMVDKAEPHLRAALEIRGRSGERDVRFARSARNWARLLEMRGEYDAAERHYRQALAIFRAASGDEDPEVASCLLGLGRVYAYRGDRESAEKMYRDALAIHRKSLGNDHPEVAASLNTLGSALADPAAAEALFREALEILRKAFGDEHPRLAWTLGGMAGIRLAAGDYDEAEKLYREALAIRRKALGDAHPDVGVDLNHLGIVLHAKGEPEAAEKLLLESLRICRDALGEDHPYLAWTLIDLANVSLGRKNYAAAEGRFREAVAIRRKAFPADGAPVADALALLGLCLLEQEKHAEAEPLLRECLSIRAQAMPVHWLRYNAMSMLGGALMGQRKHADAEPLLIEGYEKMQPPRRAAFRKREALERIVRLYDAWGKPDKAAEWRKQLPSK